MCLGIPGEVVELLAQPDLAMVDVSGVPRPINIGMLTDEHGGGVAVGDWIMLHMGFAMERMTAEEAAAALRFMEGSATNDEGLALG